MVSCFCLSLFKSSGSDDTQYDEAIQTQPGCTALRAVAIERAGASVATTERSKPHLLSSKISKEQSQKLSSRNPNNLVGIAALLKKRKAAKDTATLSTLPANDLHETHPKLLDRDCAIATSQALQSPGPTISGSQAERSGDLAAPSGRPGVAAATATTAAAIVPGRQSSTGDNIAAACHADTASLGAEDAAKPPSGSRPLPRISIGHNLVAGNERAEEGGENTRALGNAAGESHNPDSTGNVHLARCDSTSPGRGARVQSLRSFALSARRQLARQVQQQQQQLQQQRQRSLHKVGGEQQRQPSLSAASSQAPASPPEAAAGGSVPPPKRKTTASYVVPVLIRAPSPRTTNRALLMRQRTPYAVRRLACTASGSSDFLDTSQLVAAAGAADVDSGVAGAAGGVEVAATAAAACGQPIPPQLGKSINHLRLRLVSNTSADLSQPRSPSHHAVMAAAGVVAEGRPRLKGAIAVCPRRPRFIDAQFDSGALMSPHTTAPTLLARQQTPYPLRWGTAWSAADSSYDGAASDVPYSGWGASMLALMEPVTETRDALQISADGGGANVDTIAGGGSGDREAGGGGGPLRFTHTGALVEGGAAEQLGSATSMSRPWSRADSLRGLRSRLASPAAAAPQPQHPGHHNPVRALRVQLSLAKSRRPSVSSLASLCDTDAVDSGVLPIVLRGSNCGHFMANTPTRRGRRRNLAGNENMCWDAVLPRLPLFPTVGSALAASAFTSGLITTVRTELGNPGHPEVLTPGASAPGQAVGHWHDQLPQQQDGPRQQRQQTELGYGIGVGTMYGNNAGLGSVPTFMGQFQGHGKNRQQQQQQQHWHQQRGPNGPEVFQGLMGTSSVEAPVTPAAPPPAAAPQLLLHELSPLSLSRSTGAAGFSRLRQGPAGPPGPSPLRQGHQKKEQGGAEGGDGGCAGEREDAEEGRGENQDAIRAVWSILHDLETTPTSAVSTAAVAPVDATGTAVRAIRAHRAAEDEIGPGVEAAQTIFSVVAVSPVSSNACRKFPGPYHAFQGSPRAARYRDLGFERGAIRSSQSSDGRAALPPPTAVQPFPSSPSGRQQPPFPAGASTVAPAAAAAAAAAGAVTAQGGASASYRRSCLSTSRPVSVKKMAAAVIADYFAEGPGADGCGGLQQHEAYRPASVGGTSLREGRRMLRHAGSVRSHAPTEDDSAESLAQVAASELGCGSEQGGELAAEACGQLACGSTCAGVNGACGDFRCKDLEQEQLAGAGAGEGEGGLGFDAGRRSTAGMGGGGGQGWGYGEVAKAGGAGAEVGLCSPHRQVLMSELLKASAPGLAGSGASSRLSRRT